MLWGAVTTCDVVGAVTTCDVVGAVTTCNVVGAVPTGNVVGTVTKFGQQSGCDFVALFCKVRYSNERKLNVIGILH